MRLLRIRHRQSFRDRTRIFKNSALVDSVVPSLGNALVEIRSRETQVCDLACGEIVTDSKKEAPIVSRFRKYLMGLSVFAVVGAAVYDLLTAHIHAPVYSIYAVVTLGAMELAKHSTSLKSGITALLYTMFGFETFGYIKFTIEGGYPQNPLLIIQSLFGLVATYLFASLLKDHTQNDMIIPATEMKTTT